MNEYDVVVIGGGAAGPSAALVLSRARRKVAVLDGGAPRNAPASHMHGFLSRDGLPPNDLLAAGREEVRRYGGEIIGGTVVDVPRGAGPGFQVLLAGGRRLTARRVLVATGLRDELPDIPGVRERWGRAIRRAAVFVRPRFVPNSDLLVGLGCAVEDAGWVIADPTGGTSVPGVWVAGNATNPRAQAITAAGEGSAAAIALNADLVEEDIKQAVRDLRGGDNA